jgi:hypothetical protein
MFAEINIFTSMTQACLLEARLMEMLIIPPRRTFDTLMVKVRITGLIQAKTPLIPPKREIRPCALKQYLEE